MQKPFKISNALRDKIILWLINTRQLTPDQASDEVLHMPKKCYSDWLQRSNYKQRRTVK